MDDKPEQAAILSFLTRKSGLKADEQPLKAVKIPSATAF
ncbi:MAG: hypothetical protein ANABAC_1558 [Anaerolineae bacterium]|nr:MAG: hypothetical protein ANABAC_1558 [Anaerolineae bacterium]